QFTVEEVFDSFLISIELTIDAISPSVYIIFPLLFTSQIVLPLAAVGDFGVLHRQPSTNVDRSTALDLTTSAPIAANGC
ncbi:MAG: hypothetical protein NZ519_14120, partial [Bacteroidia bacterium]|nr:hypothetical protein [Bacteroidia bacterium]